MIRMLKYVLLTVTAVTLVARMSLPVGAQQTPTGSIRGVVVDQQGAIIQNASVTVTNKATGEVRKGNTGDDGIYQVSALLPGEYEIKIEAQGFATQLTTVTVVVGTTTTGDAQLRVGGKDEIVDVTSEAPLIDKQNYKVDGVITRQKVDALPLNGRNFLQLALLEPGVTVSVANPGQYNNLFNVSIGGASATNTRITVDGGSVLDNVTGGAAQNFSTETIQEFQISTFNFDLSTGVTSVGAVNIVSRTGGNELHGSGFVFWRGDQFAAVPTLEQGTPDFRRAQYGGSVGGPIVKDKALFFGNVEWLDQDSVFSAVHRGFTGIEQFNANSKSPYDGVVANVRVDFPQVWRKNRVFARYSFDDNETFAPVGGNQLPSNWRLNSNRDHNAQAGVTTTFSKWVNDFRFNYQRIGNESLLASERECPPANTSCIGLGGPQIQVVGLNSNITIGNTTDAPQDRKLDRYQFSDNVIWSKGSHSIRFGGEFEHNYGKGSWAFATPAAIGVYDPRIVLAVNAQVAALPLPAPVKAALTIPLPAAFTTPGARITLNDFLQLPFADGAVGIGDPSQPPPFNVEKARQSNRYRVYAQDAWQIRQNLTLHYGASYLYETNLFNHDMPKPAILGAFFSNLAPSPKDKNNIAPSVGFNWAPNQKTVVRGGAGMYYDTALFVTRLRERAALGPLLNGRIPASGSFFRNPFAFPQIPGLPAPLNQINPAPGVPLSFTTIPTKFTGQNFMDASSAQVAAILAQLGAIGATGVTGVEFFKTAAELLDPDNVSPYTEQASFGIQRQLPNNMAISADFVFRQFMHSLFTVDYNLNQRVASRGGPVLPRCTAAQAFDPTARCSNAEFTVVQSGNRGSYRALLVRLDKRLSNRYQFTASYTLQDQINFDTGRNLTDWFANHSSVGSRHRLTFSGVLDLPLGFQASLISVLATRGPMNATVPGNVDLDGDGTGGDTLPGLKFSSLGRGTSKSDLRQLVSQFNVNFAGKQDKRGGTIPPLVLPPDFDFGDNFQSHDVRITKTFKFAEHYAFQALFEVFNVFNNANLGGYTSRLDAGGLSGGQIVAPQTFAFGKPTSRAGQAFGTGGQRAIQFGARFNF